MRPTFALMVALSLPVTLPLTLTACAGVARQWDKPGVDREMARQDLTDCRRVAAAESLRLQLDYGGPRYGWPSAGYYGRPGYYAGRSRLDSDRFYNQGRLSNFCMRNKGYELLPVVTDNAPATRPPPRLP